MNPWPYGYSPHPYAGVPVYEYEPHRPGTFHAVRVGERLTAPSAGDTLSQGGGVAGTLVALSAGLVLGVLLGRLL
jgi:hypothetical protein